MEGRGQLFLFSKQKTISDARYEMTGCRHSSPIDFLCGDVGRAVWCFRSMYALPM